MDVKPGEQKRRKKERVSEMRLLRYMRAVTYYEQVYYNIIIE